ncbi:hypothetical protein [Flavobacterium agrisoli]|uniref:Uncharacterized protein n=1 Tax=Flavobacterium agrisoli TaxID=2793066 RepID=A0A934UKJ9_9FLAO|nr:hypothetical protein [Flavobacterium agrisoli]MBK0370638.1 hypothetical protein [Flavobacterium agrisoli]
MKTIHTIYSQFLALFRRGASANQNHFSHNIAAKSKSLLGSPLYFQEDEHLFI